LGDGLAKDGVASPTCGVVECGYGLVEILDLSESHVGNSGLGPAVEDLGDTGRERTHLCGEVRLGAAPAGVLGF
jgi:hypothetical protein